MAKKTHPLSVDDVQQSLERAQGRQTEGNQNQNPSKKFFPDEPPVSNQPPANPNQEQTCQKKPDCLDITRFAIEVLTLIVLFWYTIITNGLWTEANRQNVLSQRPWVSVDAVAAETLTFGQGGAKTLIKFTLKNLGHSPAQYVNLHFSPYTGSLHGAYTKRQEVCNRMRKLPNNADLRDTIFPGESIQQHSPFVIQKAEVDRATQRFPERAVILLFVVGCVDYQFSFAEGHHQTGFVFNFLRFDSERSNGWITIDPDKGIVPTNQIGLERVIGGSYAD